MSDHTATKRAPRLGAEDWLDAAMRLLIDEGPEALKVARLSVILGVTKGSFYWHFADIGAMREALAERFREQHADARALILGMRAKPAATRLAAIGDLAADPHRWQVEAAIRRWADTDATLAASVVDMDKTVLALAETTLTELGFDADQARSRATALLYGGIGFIRSYGQFSATAHQDLRFLINLITTP
ncbi:helix-turn-helix domain-containing protein [Gordonia sp. ABSL1-1]|uniref:TetR/AcrR family transcriptional regulator n=1 Tax=Gordonia sp. ABSL1-1 TaxID=3053923 RepID=UPI002573BCB7|nr:TetR/AcrR family transcriptional regulator [Gordonia sp. ABSL1-1]MDL9936249.1 helix-turn-helix domain-containing protein [Gordonia sp. ABSL1-1]